MPIGLVAKALGVASKGFTPFSKNMPFSLPSKCMPYDWTSAPVNASIATCGDGVKVDGAVGRDRGRRETDAVTYAAVLDLGLAHPLLRRHDAGVLRALDVLVELREADRVPGALSRHGVAGLNTTAHALQRRRGFRLQRGGRGGRRGRHEARGRRDERQARNYSGHLFLTCAGRAVTYVCVCVDVCFVRHQRPGSAASQPAENPTSAEPSSRSPAPRPVVRTRPVPQRAVGA